MLLLLLLLFGSFQKIIGVVRTDSNALSSEVLNPYVLWTSSHMLGSASKKGGETHKQLTVGLTILKTWMIWNFLYVGEEEYLSAEDNNSENEEVEEDVMKIFLKALWGKSLELRFLLQKPQ
ncbi:hypothetical protein SDJN02_17385, partial [Cucurbita argyrosperma subsp. argyrosperma]